MYATYNRKRIIKGVNLHLQIFGGLARTLLNRYYLTTIIWCAKLAPTKRKCSIVCECASLHPGLHPADIPITPEEYKSDPDVSLKHGDLYARA